MKGDLRHIGLLVMEIMQLLYVLVWPCCLFLRKAIELARKFTSTTETSYSPHCIDNLQSRYRYLDQSLFIYDERHISTLDVVRWFRCACTKYLRRLFTKYIWIIIFLFSNDNKSTIVNFICTLSKVKTHNGPVRFHVRNAGRFLFDITPAKVPEGEFVPPGCKTRVLHHFHPFLPLVIVSRVIFEHPHPGFHRTYFSIYHN